jgi:hypothetical protein
MVIVRLILAGNQLYPTMQLLQVVCVAAAVASCNRTGEINFTKVQDQPRDMCSACNCIHHRSQREAHLANAGRCALYESRKPMKLITTARLLYPRQNSRL